MRGQATVTPKRGPTRGKRRSATAQLSAQARQLLAWLLDTERAMLSGGQQQALANMGIPWDASAAAAALGVAVPSVSRTLTNLEQRRLVACWAGGSGRGRRVSHVKLSAEAVDVAEFHQRTGMSRAQWFRKCSADWAAQEEQAYRELTDMP